MTGEFGSTRGNPLYWLDRGEGLIGAATLADGSWELRCTVQDDRLYVYVDIKGAANARLASGGVGGLGLANGSRPVSVVMSLRGTHSTYCYVGQVIEDADAVELTLTDESLLSAVVLRSDLPVALWVSFPNRKAVPVGLRTRRDGADLAAVDLPAEWPGNGITSWAYR